jgi:8-oxo-dGTP pyrophosphatase MutT (NUDIX family)
MAGKERFKIIPEVCFVYIKDNSVLLGQRKNTGWQDGMYCFPAGHGEEGESAAAACTREVKEEIGLAIDPTDLKFIHVQYRFANDPGNPHVRVGFYFAPLSLEGEIKNMEPDKCEDLRFFPLNNLPPMVLPFKAAFDSILRGEMYSEFGWDKKVQL